MRAYISLWRHKISLSTSRMAGRQITGVTIWSIRPPCHYLAALGWRGENWVRKTRSATHVAYWFSHRPTRSLPRALSLSLSFSFSFFLAFFLFLSPPVDAVRNWRPFRHRRRLTSHGYGRSRERVRDSRALIVRALEDMRECTLYATRESEVRHGLLNRANRTGDSLTPRTRNFLNGERGPRRIPAWNNREIFVGYYRKMSLFIQLWHSLTTLSSCGFDCGVIFNAYLGIETEKDGNLFFTRCI